jgi:hypothetical protein
VSIYTIVKRIILNKRMVILTDGAWCLNYAMNLVLNIEASLPIFERRDAMNHVRMNFIVDTLERPGRPVRMLNFVAIVLSEITDSNLVSRIINVIQRAITGVNAFDGCNLRDLVQRLNGRSAAAA